MPAFRPNPSFLAKLVTTVQFNRYMDRVGEAGLEIAKSLVRVDEGDLKASLHVEKEGPSRRVVAGTDHWLFNEFGSQSDPGQAFLRPIIPALRLRQKR